MLKYFNDGTLQVDTLDLPQECGEVKVHLEIENEMDDCDLYLDFRCSKNVKFISQKLTKIGAKNYEVVLPSGISSYIGEVYVQLVIMKKDTSTLMSRSLIGRNPIFVIKESILAAQALESKEKRDFFEYAEKIASEVEEQLDDIKINCNAAVLEVNTTLNAWKAQVQEGKFDGVSLEFCGDWQVGTHYYSGNNGEKKISIVKIEDGQIIRGYICLQSGVATAENNPQANSSAWSEFFNIDVERKLDKAAVKNQTNTSDNSVYSAQFTNNLLDKKFDKNQVATSFNDDDLNKVPTLGATKQEIDITKQEMFAKSDIVQETGNDENKIMSQKAVTDLVDNRCFVVDTQADLNNGSALDIIINSKDIGMIIGSGGFNSAHYAEIYSGVDSNGNGGTKVWSGSLTWFMFGGNTWAWELNGRNYSGDINRVRAGNGVSGAGCPFKFRLYAFGGNVVIFNKDGGENIYDN